MAATIRYPPSAAQRVDNLDGPLLGIVAASLDKCTLVDVVLNKAILRRESLGDVVGTNRCHVLRYDLESPGVSCSTVAVVACPLDRSLACYHSGAIRNRLE